MSILDRLLKREKTIKGRIHEVAFADLSGWLRGESEKCFADLNPHFKSVFGNITVTLKETKQDVADLENAEPEGTLHLRIVKVANTSRNNIIKQVNQMLTRIKIPDETDLKSVMDFYSGTVAGINSCMENMLKSHAYTKTVFPEESKVVISDVKNLSFLLEDLISPVKEKKNLIEAFDRAELIKGTITELMIKTENNKSKSEILKNRHIELSKLIKNEKRNLDMLIESDEWKKAKLLENEVEEVDIRLKYLQDSARSHIAPIHKALTRLKKQSESKKYTLKPEHRPVLLALLESPIDAENISGFLVELKQLAGKDTLGLTPDKQRKIIEQIDMILEKKPLDSCIEEYRAVLSKYKDLQGKLSALTVYRKKKEIESGIAGHEIQLSDLEKEMASLDELVASDEKQLIEEKDELSKTVSYIAGHEIMILY